MEAQHDLQHDLGDVPLAPPEDAFAWLDEDWSEGRITPAATGGGQGRRSPTTPPTLAASPNDADTRQAWNDAEEGKPLSAPVD